MKVALLVDFGSTYTKVVAIDTDEEQILGWAQSISTVETDITVGLEKALAQLERSLSQPSFQLKHKFACSSARGGLRMIAIGLVPELTAEAARRAALGAGARILRVYSHQLTPLELAEIVERSPDMILLAGGTDGGDSRVILHNAKALANSAIMAPVVVAGNKEAVVEVKNILLRRGKDVRVTENVMPSLGRLNIEPAREIIRQLFMQKIVEAKGLKRAEEFVQSILMPTPGAVLRAASLLADGTDEEEGLGELMVVDVGGATTDVDSIAEGRATRAKVIMRGLPEPYAKRTVEGDLGLRVSAASLLEAAGKKRLEVSIRASNLDLEEVAKALANDVGSIPQAPEEQAIDDGLAKVAVRLAVERHVGTLREFYLPTGYCFVQEGKDLTKTEHLIGTGGIFAHTGQSRQILREGLIDPESPLMLKPQKPRLWIDKRYILWAMGLLAEAAPNVALRMMKRHLKEVT